MYLVALRRIKLAESIGGKSFTIDDDHATTQTYSIHTDRGYSGRTKSQAYDFVKHKNQNLNILNFIYLACKQPGWLTRPPSSLCIFSIWLFYLEWSVLLQIIIYILCFCYSLFDFFRYVIKVPSIGIRIMIHSIIMLFTYFRINSRKSGINNKLYRYKI